MGIQEHGESQSERNKAQHQEQRHETLEGHLTPRTVRPDVGTKQQKSGFGFCGRRRRRRVWGRGLEFPLSTFRNAE